MLWIKAFHIIFMVSWFSGLFYLPRLYVYHADARDSISKKRFTIMEHKLYYWITTPGGILTILFGLWLVSFNPTAYMATVWLQIKLSLVLLLVIYHVYLGKLLYDFKHNRNHHHAAFYRWINEIPTLFLISIIILVVVKPF